MSEETFVITPEGRFNFTYLFTPRLPNKPKPGQKPKYETQVIFGPDVDLSDLKKAVSACAAERWGNKAKGMNLNSPFKSADTQIEYDGYEEGGTFVRVSTTRKPRIVDGKRQDIDSEDDIYSGCWGRVAVVPFAYDEEGNRGVSLGLRMVQRTRKDDPLGGGDIGAPEDVFSEIAEADTTSADSLFD